MPILLGLQDKAFLWAGTALGDMGCETWDLASCLPHTPWFVTVGLPQNRASSVLHSLLSLLSFCSRHTVTLSQGPGVLTMAMPEGHSHSRLTSHNLSSAGELP